MKTCILPVICLLLICAQCQCSHAHALPAHFKQKLAAGAFDGDTDKLRASWWEKNGSNALGFAAIHGDMRLTKMAVRRKVNPNSLSVADYPALFYAVIYKHLGIVESLVAARLQLSSLR